MAAVALSRHSLIAAEPYPTIVHIFKRPRAVGHANVRGECNVLECIGDQWLCHFGKRWSNWHRQRLPMAQLTPRFSSNRAVRKYTEQYYLPAALAYREWAGDKGALGVQVVNWRHGLDQKWSALRFGEVTVETRG